MLNKKYLYIISAFLMVWSLALTSCFDFDFGFGNDKDNYDNWGYGSPPEINNITLSGTINVTCGGKPVPYIRIEAKSQQGWVVGSASLASPPSNNASWSIGIWAFDSSTQVCFQVKGYQDNNGNQQLFALDLPAPLVNVYDKSVTGIKLNVGDMPNGFAPENGTQIAVNTRINGEITGSGKVDWYYLDVNAGTKYYFWQNDSNDNLLPIDTFVYNNEGELVSLEYYNKSFSFTADSNRVYFKVRAYHGEDSAGAYTLYCSEYSVIIYTVTFNINGGSGKIPSPMTNRNSSYITLPEDDGFSKNGYKFRGWNTDPFGMGDNYTNTGGNFQHFYINKNIILYANWISMSSAEANAIKLTANTWVDGSITTSDDEVWYVFDVYQYSTYYVWWNERLYCDGTKTMDIKVDAYYSNDTLVFSKDGAWSIPQQFTVSYNTKVKLKVYSESNSKFNTGTFAIVFSTGSTRPGSSASVPEVSMTKLNNNKWTDGEFTSASNRVIWYSFDVSNGTTYYVWWNDRIIGDGYKTLDIKVDAFYNNDTPIFTEEDSGWSSPRQFTANSTTKVKLRVYASLGGGNYGTFAIAYSTNSARPGNGTNANPYQLTANYWEHGYISTTTPRRELCYSFYATVGNRYYIWWNDGSINSGGGGFTMNIQIIVSGGKVSYGGGWSSPTIVDVTADQTIKITVLAATDTTKDIGSFRIVYGTSNTRPN